MFPQDQSGINEDSSFLEDGSQETHLYPTWQTYQQSQRSPLPQQLQPHQPIPDPLPNSLPPFTQDTYSTSSRPIVRSPSRAVRTEKTNNASLKANASVLSKPVKQPSGGSRPTSSAASTSASGSSSTGSGIGGRIQHSACGACRLRRVKCNLQEEKQACRALFESHRTKDPHISVAVGVGVNNSCGFSLVNGEAIRFDGEVIQCLNCKQRGLKCLISFHGQTNNTNAHAEPSSSSSSSLSSSMGPPFTTASTQVDPSSSQGSIKRRPTANSKASVSQPRSSSVIPKPVSATIVDSVTGKTKVLRRGKRIVQLQDQFSAVPRDTSSNPPAAIPQASVLTSISPHGPASALDSAPDPAAGPASLSAYPSEPPGYRKPTSKPVANGDTEESASSLGPRLHHQSEDESVETLTEDFLKSPFFVRLHVQRPMVHPEEFCRRFSSKDSPSAENLGPIGEILARTMLAWAYSYGVDRYGVEEPPPTTNEDRQRRRRECNRILRHCLKDIDRLGIMRKPSYDGVQVLLLILPLTEDVASPLERLTMYEAVVNQVYSLCSLSTATYEIFEDRNAMKRDNHHEEDFLVKVRIYWYCFVHEAIKTGLKGGKLMLDEEDLYEFQNSVPNGMALVSTPQYYQLIAQYATAPIRLALACRRIHSALTGPKARRKTDVDLAQMRQAWEAIEACSEEFDKLLAEGIMLPNLQREDLERYCDGWKIFMFECHSVVREALLDRIRKLEDSQGRVVDVSDPQANDDKADCYRNIQRIHMIAEQKCSTLARTVVKLVKRHLGTQFFAYDASLVRDGIYYAATFLAADGGSADEIQACLAALDEMRWAFSKTSERTAKIKSVWADMVSETRRDAYVDSFQQINSNMVDLQFDPPSTSGLSNPLQSYKQPQNQSTYQLQPQISGISGQQLYGVQDQRQSISPRSQVESIERPTRYMGHVPSIAHALGVPLHIKDNAPEGGVWMSDNHEQGSLRSSLDGDHSSIQSSTRSSSERTSSSGPTRSRGPTNIIVSQDGGLHQQLYIDSSQYNLQHFSHRNQHDVNRDPRPMFTFPDQSYEQPLGSSTSLHSTTSYGAFTDLATEAGSRAGFPGQVMHPTPYQPYIPPPFDPPALSSSQSTGLPGQINHTLYASHTSTYVSSTSFSTYPTSAVSYSMDASGTIVHQPQQLSQHHLQTSSLVQPQRQEQPQSQSYPEPISPRSQSYTNQNNLYQ